MEMNEFQRRAAKTDQNPRKDKDGEVSRAEVIPLLGLVGEVGGLLAEYKKLIRDGAIHRKFKDEVAEELGDILWYVADVASKFDLTLAEIAESNLRKVEDRWNEPAGRRLLDAEYPPNQQLPRRFEFLFRHERVGDVEKLVLVDLLNGGTSGDPLTDNAYDDDGYRYHDVLHLALAARLGWSPVWRKLLRKNGKIVNREPNKVADVEDGGRAQVIEEAIVASAYLYAADHDFQKVPTVDWKLLRHIKQLTAGLEVRSASTWEWNDALQVGFEVWRRLRENRGGIVRGDLTTGAFSYEREAAK